MAKKELVKMDLRKVGLETFIDLKVAGEVEEFFRETSKEGGVVQTDISQKWLNADGSGLKFYRKSAKMSDKVQNVENVKIIDNFGNGLLEYREGSEYMPTLNVALLRAVGASNGVSVKVDDLIAYDDVKKYMQLFGTWIKQFYLEYILSTPIQTSVLVEIDN